MERTKSLTFQVTEEEKKAVMVWQAEQTVKRGERVTREDAIRELIARGLQARPHKKKIDLGTADNPAEVQIMVDDDGEVVPGLKEAVQQAAERNKAGTKTGWC